MFKLLHVEYLLEEIVELFLGHHLVTKHCCGQSLTWPSRLILWKVSCYNMLSQKYKNQSIRIHLYLSLRESMRHIDIQPSFNQEFDVSHYISQEIDTFHQVRQFDKFVIYL